MQAGIAALLSGGRLEHPIFEVTYVSLLLAEYSRRNFVPHQSVSLALLILRPENSNGHSTLIPLAVSLCEGTIKDSVDKAREESSSLLSRAGVVSSYVILHLPRIFQVPCFPLRVEVSRIHAFWYWKG